MNKCQVYMLNKIISQRIYLAFGQFMKVIHKKNNFK